MDGGNYKPALGEGDRVWSGDDAGRFRCAGSICQAG
jgi:hypothetical protein